MIPANLPLTLYRGTTFAFSLVTKDDDGNVVPLLGGWTPLAKVRVSPQKPVVLDLAPVISDESGGVISISFTDEETTAIAIFGEFVWDFLLQRPTGEILGPFVSGTFSIKTATSRVT